MSNNNASNNLIIAQRAVKQLRLEASIRRIKDQLNEKDEHVVRLQELLKYERDKCTRLQMQCNHQKGELRWRELQNNRLKERLLQQVTGKHRASPAIEVLNFPLGSKKEQSVRPNGSPVKPEDAAVRLMLGRREAELREAMKLRHSLTTALHALRVDMEQNLSGSVNAAQDGHKNLDQAEEALGEHVTGGVVRSWRKVQRRLKDIQSEGQTTIDTDQEKLLVQLQMELMESQQLVRLQQQLLQDNFASPVPSELADSYFLEEWERLQTCWAELRHLRKTFEKERKTFTEAVIRLGQERRDFEEQKALLLKQQYLCDSPQFGKGAASDRRESTALNFTCLGPSTIPGCLPLTPSSTESGNVAGAGLHYGRAGVQIPSTPELYKALDLSYSVVVKLNAKGQEIWTLMWLCKNY
ncbi:afadin- and alpha-actinin-binding protein B [Pholidichthys leucotaenia]